MKLEPVTKLNNENSGDDVICDAIVSFAMYCQFGTFQKLDPTLDPKSKWFRIRIQNPKSSGRMVCKVYIFIKSNLLPSENWKQN